MNTTLYKMDKSGGTRIWKIWNVLNVIHVEYGKMDCTMISEKIHVTEGLGGRSLEQQVALKMNSKIILTKDFIYVVRQKTIQYTITHLLRIQSM